MKALLQIDDEYESIQYNYFVALLACTNKFSNYQ